MGDASDSPDDRVALKLAGFRDAVGKLGVSTKELDDATCLRFLVARSMHIDKAAAMYADYHTWRHAFVPLGHIPFDQVVSEFNTGKAALQGHSKKGNPLLIILGFKHLPNKHDHDTFKRSVVYILDKTLASAPSGVEKMFVIVDLKHLSYSNIDIKGFTSGFQLLQNYYPERLGVLYMVNVPNIFLRFWKMISRFLDKATKEKIVFLEDHSTMEVLLTEVDAAMLPTMYGGKAELVLLQDAHVPNWPEPPIAALT